MLKIRITKTPPGFADEAIRAQWVGVEIPLVSEDEAAKVESEMNPKSPSAGGYIVRGVDAIQSLKDAGKEKAAAFWANPTPPFHLRFAKDYCEVI